MPSELRFCRNCGFRLGLGYGDQNQQLAQSTSAPLPVPKKRRRRSGMTWVFVGLLVFFIGAAAFTAIINPVRNNVSLVKAPVIKAYVGVDGWDTTDNGVTFGSIDAPDGPADKAGLVGGDIITKFDGQDIRDEDQMDELMTRTPIGKTVEVAYIRDGRRRRNSRRSHMRTSNGYRDSSRSVPKVAACLAMKMATPNASRFPEQTSTA
jgi:hypothetical protein